MNARKRDLIGRTITAVDWRQFPRGGDRRGVAHDPVLTLDNGAKVTFSTEETEGEYGTRVQVERP